MLLLRQLTPFTRASTRFYNKKGKHHKMSPKQVHQETLRHVKPDARINICSDITLKVRSADVHEYPDGDAFLAELHGGGHVKNCTASMDVKVSDDDKQVDVIVSKLADFTDFHCELEVPIKADVHINAKNEVVVQNLLGDELHVKTDGSIKTKDIRAANISLQSSGGNIDCLGLLLGKRSNIATKNGNISLDKLLGEKLNCKTSAGTITTNSCYTEVSKFETDTGNLQLKNVHKITEVCVNKKGDLNMTGVHGNINVRSNGGSMNIQLSEINGENTIMADAVDEAKINISDAIEENSYIEITSTGIELDSSLSHLSDCISADNRVFKMSRKSDNDHKLMICTKGDVKLGKLSWADNIRISLESKTH